MAISFSRPDPSSPAAIADANFPTARRGFDQQQVRDFLRMVGAELARAHERERYLEQELRTRLQQPVTQFGLPPDLDDETIARLLGEETTRIVQAARESAAAMRLRAEEQADRLVRDARDEAARVREEADLDATRARKDAEADANAELEMAKQQGREMVEEARSYRERTLAELGRRRDLARQQIDHLVHARDRLVQAFERARLVAADVVSDLAPLGELDEYVNLSPTTGPVPVMVPASTLRTGPAASPEPDPADAVATAAAAAAAAVTEGPDDVATDEVLEVIDAEEVLEVADDAAEPDDDATAEMLVPPPPVIEESFGRNATVLQFPVKARAVEELDEVDGFDEVLDEVTIEPAVDRVEELADDDDITASDIDDLFARLRAERVEPPAPETVSDTDAGPDAAMIVDGSSAEPDTDDTSITDSRAPNPFEVRDEALTPLIVASGRKLKRVLADEQNAALDRLRGKEAVVDLAQLVPDEADHVGAYFDAVADDVAAAITAGASAVGGSADTTLVQSVVRETLRVDLVAPLRERLATRVAASDGDNDVVTKAVRAVYREWKTRHIDDHLDDLLRVAYNRGVLAAVPANGAVEWLADPSVGACSECEDNTLQRRTTAGDVFPTGHLTAPAHAGCRCLVLPVDR